jgi:polar amino acid transport system substrate-binding protein
MSMNPLLPIALSVLPRVLVATALACSGANAFADGAFEHAKQRGKLTAGIAYPVPTYQAGAKFRTPEAIDSALAEELAKRVHLAPAIVRAAPAQAAHVLRDGSADLLLASAEADTLRGTTLVPTGYTAGPMAIMRSDTDIKRWEQLKGRTVCLSEGGRYVGTIAARYGAIEKVLRAPADSLLALRTGGCDAAVHDDTMLEELLKLPEWKKFSARLPVARRTPLVFAVPAGAANSTALLQQLVADWRASGYLDQLNRKRVRSIAFEVYLDQDAPDCH